MTKSRFSPTLDHGFRHRRPATPFDPRTAASESSSSSPLSALERFMLGAIAGIALGILAAALLPLV